MKRLIAACFFLLFVSQDANSQDHLPIMASGVAFPRRPVDRYVTNNGLLLTVVQSRSVQQELRFTHGQTKKIDDLQKDRQKKLGYLYRSIDKQVLNEIQIAEAGDDISRLQNEIEQQVVAILSDKQKTRLAQLVYWEKIWRYGFINLLLDSKLGEELAVTADQKTQLKKAAKDLVAEIEKLDRWCTEYVQEQLIKKLTPKQRILVKKMLGKNENAKSWRPVTSTHVVKRLSHHWSASQKEKIFSARSTNQLRPEPNYVPTINASQNTQLQFVVFLKVNGVAEELDLVHRQQTQLQQAGSEYKAEYKKLIRQNKQLRKSDLTAFRKIMKAAEDRYYKKVFEGILVPHQSELLKRLYYSNQVRMRGLLHCLTDKKDFALGSYLDVTKQQSKELQQASMDAVTTTLKKQKKIQERSVFAFIELLNHKQQKQANTIIGEIPKAQSFASLDSIAIQLKYATGQVRPNQ